MLGQNGAAVVTRTCLEGESRCCKTILGPSGVRGLAAMACAAACRRISPSSKEKGRISARAGAVVSGVKSISGGTCRGSPIVVWPGGNPFFVAFADAPAFWGESMVSRVR